MPLQLSSKLIQTGGLGWETGVMPQDSRTQTWLLFTSHTRQPLLGYSSLHACGQSSDGSQWFPFQLTSVSVASPTFKRPWPPYPDRMESKIRRPPGNVRQAGPSSHPSGGSGAALGSFRKSTCTQAYANFEGCRRKIKTSR
jgi:hypothetical protein